MQSLLLLNQKCRLMLSVIMRGTDRCVNMNHLIVNNGVLLRHQCCIVSFSSYMQLAVGKYFNAIKTWTNTLRCRRAAAVHMTITWYIRDAGHATLHTALT